MIRSIVIINQQGKPRLARFYDGSSFERQQFLIKKMHSLASMRDLREQSSIIDGTEYFGKNSKIIYRNFATLYFIFVADEAESELSILDLIQVFVQTLNTCFESVCELDIIFNFDKVNYILDEIVVGGMVLDLNTQSIIEAVTANDIMCNSTASGPGGLLPTNALSAAVFRLSS